jgi:DNA modification methylase
LIVKKGGNIAFGPEIYRTKPKTDIDALNYFITNSTQMIQDLEEFRNGQTVTTIIHGDSRDVHKCLNPELLGQIDCIITSPPYPNEKDYTRSTRLESVLLGFIKDKHDLRLMKESLLRSNSRNIYVSDSDGNFVTQFDSIEKIANDIEEKRVSLNKSSGFEKQYHKIVRHYFGGMYLHFKNLKPYLSSNAKLAYVVGDQMSFFQTHIPTAQILGEIAESLNYKVKEVELWRTRLATATKLNIDENILILENV